MQSNVEYFKTTKNELNGWYMIHSDCEQLAQAYAVQGKGKANQFKDELNRQANLEARNYKGQITWKQPIK